MKYYLPVKGTNEFYIPAFKSGNVGKVAWNRIKEWEYPELDDGELTIKQAMYAQLVGTPTKIHDYLYAIDYGALDYRYGFDRVGKASNLSIGACSSVRNGNLYGRNLDWYYSNQVDFVVRTPADDERFAVVGTAGGLTGLSRAFVESGAMSEDYCALPFMLQDGMNSEGLVASYNVVPSDYGKNVALPTSTQEVELNALMLVRYILDNFDTALTACNYIREHCKVVHPKALHEQNYELHVMVADATSTYALEFAENETKVLNITSTPYLTNFYRYGVTLNADNTVYTPATQDETHNAMDTNLITANGMGLERHNLIVNGYSSASTKAGMRSLMNSLYYSRMYPTSSDPAEWYTELVGNGRTCASPVADFADAMAEAGQVWLDKSRDNPEAWITTHSVIYDMSGSMWITSQEGTDEATPQTGSYVLDNATLLIR